MEEAFHEKMLACPCAAFCCPAERLRHRADDGSGRLRATPAARPGTAAAVFDLLSNLTSTGDADGTQSAAPPRMQELFPIFPPDALLQRAQDRDYHHLYRYTLLQDELFTRLSCRYSAADYQAEVDRPRGARRNL